MTEKTKRLVGVGVVQMVLAFAMAFAFVAVKGRFSATADSGAVPVTVAGKVPTEVGALTSTFAPVVKNSLPAVVSIVSTKVVKNDGAEGLEPFFNNPQFREFFGDRLPNQRQPRSQKQRGLGSGVIVNSDGYILTNNHVIDGANDIKIAFHDGREVKARVIGADPKTDIALLKVEEKNLPVLAFADSAQVQVGDLALAIGNPLGVGQTVTMGIISATGRGNLGIEDYEDFIQTDAAINPGNSGGALINTRGELIGINTAILSRSGGNQGVGFAVPANLARHVMDQLSKGGKVVRGYIGTGIQDVTPEIAKAFGLPNSRGALIGDVTEGGPASKAGIAKGDVITEVNGQAVADNRELRLKISQLAPGTPVKLKVFRDGAMREVTVTLGELPNEDKTPEAEQPEDSSLEGISVETLTPQMARQFQLPTNVTGVVVTKVDADSAAGNAGLQRGDVIQRVNRKSVNTAAEFREAMKQAGQNSAVLLVNRGGRTSFVVVPGQ
ncbi:MAG TPA: DegQ family serine endoprotease [Blastocatellia bacterium]|nr:DegQ family serine endoprotease [Blastocatellia bacterium]HMX25139.1 DegQ family serine endoprotease [Blastocatellia bacterium]HMZ22215.1 DegQ family serine endoprotease [Blastocatellia bacterium]HNG32737.1 DegQ family serine endoprotease [Blastocatellia bacterium]